MWALHVLVTGNLLCPFCVTQTPLRPFLCIDGEYEGRVGIKCHKPHKIPWATYHYPAGVAPPAEVYAHAAANPKSSSPTPSPSSSMQALATLPGPLLSTAPLASDHIPASSMLLAPFPMLAVLSSSMPSPLPATAPHIKKSRRTRASDFVPKLSKINGLRTAAGEIHKTGHLDAMFEGEHDHFMYVLPAKLFVVVAEGVGTCCS